MRTGQKINIKTNDELELNNIGFRLNALKVGEKKLKNRYKGIRKLTILRSAHNDKKSREQWERREIKQSWSLWKSAAVLELLGKGLYGGLEYNLEIETTLWDE